MSGYLFHGYSGGMGIFWFQYHKPKYPFQVTVLESIDEPKKKLLVATTHLYFHPIANNVRMIQSIIALLHIEKVKKMYRDQVG